MNVLSKSLTDSPENFTLWLERIPEEGGIILVNKDEGWTSFEVVRKVRNLLKIKKVGHAGTLDPLAKGIVVIAVGKATKLLNFLQNDEKQYSGRIKLGATTPSYDRETEEVNPTDINEIDEDKIRKIIPDFLGEINQYPPVYSALKFNGKRAYEFARKNENIPLEPRKLFVRSLVIPAYDPPFVDFIIDVSKGFYVRSFAHDFGQKLGVTSYLYTLTRTMSGQFNLNDAIELIELESLIHQKNN